MLKNQIEANGSHQLQHEGAEADAVLAEFERVLTAYVWMLHSKRTAESLPSIVSDVRAQAGAEHEGREHEISTIIGAISYTGCWGCSRIRDLCILIAKHPGDHIIQMRIVRRLTRTEEEWLSKGGARGVKRRQTDMSTNVYNGTCYPLERLSRR